MNALDLPGAGREDEPHHAKHEAKGLALAIALVAIGLGCATVVFIHGTRRLTADRPEDCAPISDSDARLDCYDISVHRAVSQPARGAIAPGTPAN